MRSFNRVTTTKIVVFSRRTTDQDLDAWKTKFIRTKALSPQRRTEDGRWKRTIAITHHGPHRHPQKYQFSTAPTSTAQPVYQPSRRLPATPRPWNTTKRTQRGQRDSQQWLLQACVNIIGLDGGRGTGRSPPAGSSNHSVGTVTSWCYEPAQPRSTLPDSTNARNASLSHHEMHSYHYSHPSNLLLHRYVGIGLSDICCGLAPIWMEDIREIVRAFAAGTL